MAPDGGSRSLWKIISTPFARREDPYAGNDLENARRMTGAVWLIHGTVIAVLLPFVVPAGHYTAVAWVIAGIIVLDTLARALRWITTPGATFNALLIASYVGLAELVVLQVLAGDGASAYQELYLLIGVATATVHPPRRVAPFLLVLCLAAMLPLLYRDWTTVSAADLSVRLLLWIALSALSMILVATLRSQRKALQEETEHAHRLANQDPLTGIGNRRRLMSELPALLPVATARRPLVLATLDLDGFKAYNDTYGHPSGDALLRRLGERLSEAMRGRGHAYRMGGDEFCIAALVAPADAATIVERAAAALSEHGDHFSIGCSYGRVVLPHEDVVDASTALQLADRRMYARKNLGRMSAGTQATDALLQVLSERSADLGSHMRDVTALCDSVAVELGLSLEERGHLQQAASLHDIGKSAIPDSILDKPGQLSAEEWSFMHTHTLIGERIMLAAPALKQAAKLVRSSHERFDGSGYPDALSGDEIPLGARIISVCDAYDAMVSRRPYRARMSAELALEEIRRCATSQFDPRVVDAFCAALAEPDAGGRPRVASSV
jgi:diguanylate cyclase (GGDEF)-like protein